MKKCVNCGTLLPDSAEFCNKCGARCQSAVNTDRKSASAEKGNYDQDGSITNLSTRKQESGAITNQKSKQPNTNPPTHKQPEKTTPRTPPRPPQSYGYKDPNANASYSKWVAEQERINRAAEQQRIREQQQQAEEQERARKKEVDRLNQIKQNSLEQMVHAERCLADIMSRQRECSSERTKAIMIFIFEGLANLSLVLFSINNNMGIIFFTVLFLLVSWILTSRLTRPVKPGKLGRFILAAITFNVFSIISAIVTLVYYRPGALANQRDYWKKEYEKNVQIKIDTDQQLASLN